jgi:hypothetical protein
MHNVIRVSLAWCLLGGATLWVAFAADDRGKATDVPANVKADARQDLELAKFMRKKLEASTDILEGLTTEDSELVVRGARILVEMSSAEKWQVKHDVMYKQFSADFQRSATSLLDAAEKKNFDTATLKWIDTTMRCLECHKFVRGARLVGKSS